MKQLTVVVGFLLLQCIFAISIDNHKISKLSESVPVEETSKSSTEEPLIPCPPNMSLHTKEDIQTMIDYRVETLSILKSINNSYYSRAIEVCGKHTEDFNQFWDWYLKRPKHLKHNLEDIEFLRNHIEPFVKRVARAIEQYPQLHEKYNEKLNKTNALLKKLNRYKIICENNCESNSSFHISRRTKRSNFNGYYCSSLKDLDQNIQQKLQDFQSNISSAMLDRITYDDEALNTRIDVLKTKLKDIALNKFGKTMYDILSLQDEYHHYIQDLKEVDAKSVVNTIKESTLLIDTKLLEFEERIEGYGSYCRKCNEISEQPTLRISTRRMTPQKKQSKLVNLLHYLLNLKYIEIQNSTNIEYDNIFKKLDSTLNEADSKDVYVTDLKPIQDEIIEMLNKQQAEFEELKKIAAPSSVKKITKLSSDLKDLLSKVIREIDNLNKIWPK